MSSVLLNNFSSFILLPDQFKMTQSKYYSLIAFHLQEKFFLRIPQYFPFLHSSMIIPLLSNMQQPPMSGEQC